MKTAKVKLVDAFTNRAFAGNPAGVVLDAKGIEEDSMRKIAHELNLSETAFVLPPTAPGADIRIRWFTPTEEVALCGHATVAAFHGLAEEGLAGMKANGQHYFRLETASGILTVKVEKNFHGNTVEFQLPVPAFKKRRNIPADLLRACGIRIADLDETWPTVSEASLYIPVRNRTVLARLNPDFSALAAWCRRLKVVGVCVLTLDTVEKESSVHSRYYAPSVGIDEDPVTGSANGPLAAYLHQFVVPEGKKVPSRILPDGRIEYVGEQGDEIGRPGRVRMRLRVQENDVTDVTIAGEAVTVMSATLQY